MTYPIRLIHFCLAIQAYEGYYPGSRSWRNRNAGNVRFVRQAKATRDEDGYAVFPTYEDGFTYLLRMVKNAATGKSRIYNPNMTIEAFFKTYAPTWDSNHPENYAKFVARWIDVTVSTPISYLV